MKFFLKIALIALILIGVSEPVFASYPAKQHPKYIKDYNYFKDNSCNAVAMIPYSGKVLYECASGSFWSSVLVPTKKSPLFMYFKNRKHEDDEDAEYTSAAASASASFSYY